MLFADDSIFFIKGTIEESQSLNIFLNDYCKCSGQKRNLEKSGIIFSQNASKETQESLSNVLHIPIIHKAGKFIGMPMEWGKSKRAALEWIKARILPKIAGWKEQFLTQAGKEVLAVVQAIPNYAMNLSNSS